MTSTTESSRLDVELVHRGLARSRGDARDLIAHGQVVVGGRTGVKASTPVHAGADITVERPGPAWVSRSAAKLEHALTLWGATDRQGATSAARLRVAGRACLDVGASTGGFTQVLLHHGASSVIALDVGRDQLAGAIATHPRVRALSGTSIRDVSAERLGGPVDVVVADLSFISLTLVLDTLAALVSRDGDVVVLVKPQFEVGRAALGRSGVVTDPRARRRALTTVLASAQASGLHPHGLAVSPVRGGRGNAEYLLWARPDASGRMGQDAVTAAVVRMSREEAP